MKYAPWCLMALLFMTGIVRAEEEAPPDIQRYIDAAKKLPDGVNETVWQM
ncbi:conjugal transfer protein, partial [Escherichia coli]|nr:conjugal transfer protein [Escherichia coli]